MTVRIPDDMVVYLVNVGGTGRPGKVIHLFTSCTRLVATKYETMDAVKAKQYFGSELRICTNCLRMARRATKKRNNR